MDLFGGNWRFSNVVKVLCSRSLLLCCLLGADVVSNQSNDGESKGADNTNQSSDDTCWDIIRASSSLNNWCSLNLSFFLNSWSNDNCWG